MSFTSWQFLIFAFAVIAVYFITPKRFRWIALLIANAVFYLMAGWQYCFYLLFTSLTVWGAAFLVGYLSKKAETEEDERKRKSQLGWGKATVVITILLNIGVLFVVKYLEWSTGIFNSLFHTDLPIIHIVVPLGISFYTFSSLGYLIDVYRGEYDPEKNYFKLFTAISFFPTVLQGPICSFGDFLPQVIEGHDFDGDEAWWGLKRMFLGFFKKIVIANLIAIPTSYIFNNYSNLGGGVCILGAVFYAIQLYADFSGYMDIAIGMARILGIKLPENFDVPYLSRTVAEYWRRWHITLGAWFRNYLYYPIMRSALFRWMNRKLSKWNRQWANRIVTAIALGITWLLTGIWHGAAYTYIFYGLYYGFILAMGVLLDPFWKWLKKKLHINDKVWWFKAFQTIRTFGIVCFCYIFFNGTGIRNSAKMALKALRFWEHDGIGVFQSWGIAWWAYLIIVAAILICYFMNSIFREVGSQYLPKFDLSKKWGKAGQVTVLALVGIATVAVLLYEMSLGDFESAFIYFEF